MRHRRGVTYATVMVLDLLLAGTAILGGIFIVPTLPPGWLEGTPFTSYLFPAMALTLIGLVALVGGIELAFERPLGVLVSLLAGFAIVAYEVVQIAALTLGDWLHPLGIAVGHHIDASQPGLPPAMYLEPVYLTLGLAIAYWASRLYRGDDVELDGGAEQGLQKRKAAQSDRKNGGRDDAESASAPHPAG